MGVSIYKLFQVTYSDYISDYDRCLSEFLNDYEDNTELYFIKEQKSILDSHLTKFKDVVMNLVDEDENKEEILDLFRNRINTTDRIKAFLEQRKQDLERESNLIVPAPAPGEQLKNNSMYTSAIHFYESAIKGLVSELDILNFIDEATKNDLSKLEALHKGLEESEINFTASEVVESYFSNKVHNPISISEKFIKFKEIVLSKIEEQQLEKQLNLNVPVAKDVNKKKITANQLALMMVYEGNTLVTREEHGNDLYNKVTKWAKVKTRTANDGTNLQLENKIRMFEVVIELLDDRYKQKAIDEVKILKSYLPKN